MYGHIIFENIKKYDIEKLEKEFLKSENGKQYKVMRDGHSRWTTTTRNTTVGGMPISLPNILPRTDITEDEWEYKKQNLFHIPNLLSMNLRTKNFNLILMMV